MLLNSCRRARVLFNVCRYRNRLNIFQAAEAGALAPIQELADGMVISDPRVLVPDGNGEKFEVSLGRFRADIGDERWNLEGSGFDEAQGGFGHWCRRLAKCKATNYFARFLPHYFAQTARQQ
jgi:hypothetical protein